MKWTWRIIVRLLGAGVTLGGIVCMIIGAIRDRTTIDEGANECLLGWLIAGIGVVILGVGFTKAKT